MLTLRNTDPIGSYQPSVEPLKVKEGTISLIMGGMPFFNRYVCYKLRICIPQYAKAFHS